MISCATEWLIRKSQRFTILLSSSRGGSDAQTSLSLEIHPLGQDNFIFAVCQDHKLRMWSTKVQLQQHFDVGDHVTHVLCTLAEFKQKVLHLRSDFGKPFFHRVNQRFI